MMQRRMKHTRVAAQDRGFYSESPLCLRARSTLNARGQTEHATFVRQGKTHCAVGTRKRCVLESGPR
jgi:hypothetical protein